MKKSLLAVLALSLGSGEMLASQPNLTNHPDSVYVATYANGSATEGIKMAYSSDRKTWMEIGTNHSFVKSDFGAWGSNKKMYSPSVLFDGGMWRAVWSVNERDPQFATTQSADFWLWKPQDYPYAAKGENVLATTLTKEGKAFVVSYKTSGNNYYEMRSEDFSHWSAPKAIDSATYAKRQHSSEVKLGNRTVTADVHKVPYAMVENLLARTNDAAQRGRANSERMSDDPQRFRGIKALKSTLQINLDDTKAISPNLIGIFFEDINYSADGGLYAELVQNRDFEYSRADRNEWNSLTSWTLNGDGEVTVETESPLHANNSHWAKLTTKSIGASLVNSGYDGIVVAKGESYDLSLFVNTLGAKSRKLKVRLMDGTDEIASAVITATGQGWKQYRTSLRPSKDATKAVLAVEPQETGTVGIDFVSLFPRDTFKGRANGMRRDLAQTLADLHPRFVRFPGGCVSHGNGLDNMYRWRTTIGPLWEREQQFNLWGYHQSKGIGFYEYFQFCEDIGAEPLPVLPAGVCCQNSSRGGAGQQGGLPMEEMEAYTQELLDLIEWANGDPKTSALARMRAEAGHPKPFNLKMLGVGNEDLISDVFTERFNYINRRIKAKHPEIQVVGTAGPFFEGSDYEYGWQLARQEHIDILDEHYYVDPGWYFNNQNYYDKYDREGTKVYLGEWASRGNRLENALAEAIHVTNLERNADVVTMSSYAPLLAKEGHTQWNPDLIYFNNNSVSPTVNYWIQQMCGTNSGTLYVYSDLDVRAVTENREGADVEGDMREGRNRIGRSVVIDEKTGDIIVKMVNATPIEMATELNLSTFTGYATTATMRTVSGNPSDRNNAPKEQTVGVGKNSTVSLPPYSFSVIRIAKGKGNKVKVNK